MINVFHVREQFDEEEVICMSTKWSLNMDGVMSETSVQQVGSF